MHVDIVFLFKGEIIYHKPGPFLLYFKQDIWQYFTNLTQANLMNKPNWLIEYKATEAFNISDVSPQSLHSLVQSFKRQGSPNFRKYYLYNSVSAGGEQCDGECKTAQICGITEIDFDRHDACVALPSESTTASNRFTVQSGSVRLSFCLITSVLWLFYTVVLFKEVLTDP